MHIGFDASTLSTQGGPRTYVQGLLDALLQLDRDNRYTVFYNDTCHLGRFPLANEMVLPGKSPLARLWREHILLPAACRREKIDLLHCPKSAIPLFSPCPTVVTLHDLIPLRHPETEKFVNRCYWRLQIPIAARRSDFVITDSEHARQEIMADYGVPADRIKAIMLGFDPRMAEPRNPVTGAKVRARYNLPEQYLLYVGTIQPRKNIATLIEAFNLLKKEQGIPNRLVIVGRKGWLYDQLFARIRELGLAEEIIFTGFVPDEDLPFIYDGALIFAYLSLFEGFGLPPLEAMACGVPVITSDATSLPEVVGRAGITLPPTDVNAVRDALWQVLSDGKLRETMRGKGAARAREFSWEKAASETLDIYRKVSQAADDMEKTI